MEDKVLMTPLDEDSPQTLIPVRAESLSPSTVWPKSWILSRLHGLESDLSSFLFKPLHRIIPSQDRVSRIVRAEEQVHGLCQLCHAFFSCPHNRVADLGLLGLIEGICTDLQPEDALQLYLGEDLPPDDELVAVYLVATGLKFIWEARLAKKQTSLFQVRAEQGAKISMLRRTRYFPFSML